MSTKHTPATQEECTCPAKQMPFGRCCKAAPVAKQRSTLLAEDHKGMRVDYSGLLKQARTALGRREPALAEMLRQLQDHITELGTRWYAGDTDVVDELLQLYCVEKGARDALVTERTEAA